MKTLTVFKMLFIWFFVVGCTNVFDIDQDKVPPEMIQLETKPDGSGTAMSESVQLSLSEKLSLYAIYRNESGEYIKNVEVSWRLVGTIGELTLLSNGTSAKFSSSTSGSAVIEMVYQDKVIKSVSVEVLPTPQPSLTWSIINEQATTSEGDTFEVTFYLSKAYDKVVSFEVSTANQTAIAGSDYVGKASELVSIPIGQTQTTVSISILSDNYYENLDEAFTFEVSNLQNALTSLTAAEITIVDSDSAPSVSIADLSVIEDIGSAVITVTLSHGSYQTTSVDFQSSDDTAVSSGSYIDFTALSGTLTFLPGETSKTISVTINNDSLDELNESFDINLSNPVNLSSITDGTASVTINDNDDPPSLSISDVSVNEGSSAQLTVNFSSISGRSVSFDWQTADGGGLAGADYNAQSLDTITLPAYVGSVNLNVSTIDDSDYCEVNDTFLVNLSNADGATFSDDSATVTINENDVPEIIITDAPSVTEGTKATYTASLSAACALDVSFEYKTYPLDAKEGHDYIYTSGIANLPASSPTANIEVQTVDNNLYEGDQQFLLVAVNNENLINAKTSNTSIAVTKIIDNDTGLPEPHVADFSVAPGLTHSACAVMGDGDVKCWGKTRGVFHFGEFSIGDEPNEMGDNLEPVYLGSVAGDGVTPFTIKKMSVGDGHACATLDNDQLKCWGSNGGGGSGGAKLGVGLPGWQDWGRELAQMGDNLKVVETGTDDIPLEAQAGGYMTCSIFYPQLAPSNTFVKCWGDTDYLAQGDTGTDNEIGNGVNDVRDLPAIDFGVTAGVYVDQLSVGITHACALLTNGDVYCWGANTYGQLGINSSENFVGNDDFEVGVGFQKVILNGDSATQISVGDSYSCAVLSNGRAKCWGWGSLGELGDGNNGWNHRVGDSASEMEALGYINIGTTDGTTPRLVNLIRAGSDHTCVIFSDNNQVKCFGENSDGQLGIGSTEDAVWGSELGDNLQEVNLGAGLSAKDLYLGDKFTCALLNTDQIKCWGRNTKGQLGYEHTNNIGDEPSEISLAPVVDLGMGRTVKSFSKGFSRESVCVVLDNDQVKCWGKNPHNAFARTDMAFGDAPGEMGANLISLNIAPGVKARQITLGDANCIISTTDEVYCWGTQYEGALGNAVNERYNVIGGQIFNLGNFPKALIPSGVKPLKLEVSLRTVCVLFDDFTVRCWGDGGDGKTGVGIPTSQNIEYVSQMGDNLQAIDFGSDVYPIELTSNQSGFCAILNNQSVKCWGRNNTGQLGVESTVSQLGDNLSLMGDSWSAVMFGEAGFTSGKPRVKKIAGAADSYCALFENSKIKCWGTNYAGVLGYEDSNSRGRSTGSMGDNLAFVNLGTSTLVKDIFGANFDDRFCALTTDEELKCWGDDGNIGLLGRGYSTSPKGDGAGEMGDNLEAAKTGSTNIQSAESNGAVACALYINGQIKCWTQSNYWGITGQGHDDPLHETANIGDNMPFIDLE